MDAQHWDDMYRSRDQVSSGNPNPVLVSEATELPPGQALDVRCGEGADALWLARHGWQVTAIDVSPTALRHPLSNRHPGAHRLGTGRPEHDAPAARPTTPRSTGCSTLSPLAAPSCSPPTTAPTSPQPKTSTPTTTTRPPTSPY